MPDFRLMQSANCIRAIDLGGKPRVVKIVRVTQGEYKARSKKDKDKRMPDVWFEGWNVPLGANATNCKMIFQLLGTRITEQWIGRCIEIYPTTTEAYSHDTGRVETMDCIRVSPRLPKEDRGPQQRPAPQQPQARGSAPQQARQPSAPQPSPAAQYHADEAAKHGGDDRGVPPPAPPMTDDERREIERQEREQNR